MILQKEFEYGGLKYRAWSDGRIMGLGRNNYLKKRINEDGYEEVTMGSNKQRNSRIKVHRVIATLFVDNDNPSLKVEVNHKDFIG